MKDKEDNFELFDYDQNRLDEEWRNQSKLYAKQATKLANARRTLAQTEAQLDLVRAELDIQIRETPDKYDIPKVTEPAIKNVIICQQEYKDALKAFIDAKHRVDVLSGYVKALDHRKKGLENAVELFLADYFSAPRAKSGKSKEHTDRMERKRAFRPIKQREKEDENDDD